jgi:hypothetical protein
MILIRREKEESKDVRRGEENEIRTVADWPGCQLARWQMGPVGC